MISTETLLAVREALEFIAFIEEPTEIPLEAVAWRTTSQQQADAAKDAISLFDTAIAQLQKGT